MTVQYTKFMNDIHKTCASHTDLKPRFVLVVHLCITYKCSVFLYFVTKELSYSGALQYSFSLNMKVLSMILAMPSYSKGALITCIYHCHLLELTLLCLVDF